MYIARLARGTGETIIASRVSLALTFREIMPQPPTRPEAATLDRHWVVSPPAPVTHPSRSVACRFYYRKRRCVRIIEESTMGAPERYERTYLLRARVMEDALWNPHRGLDERASLKYTRNYKGPTTLQPEDSPMVVIVLQGRSGGGLWAIPSRI